MPVYETRYEDSRRKRLALIGDLWFWHAQTCACRSTDGGRCDNARAIHDADLTLRKVESLLLIDREAGAA